VQKGLRFTQPATPYPFPHVPTNVPLRYSHIESSLAKASLGRTVTSVTFKWIR
jgi:hypothetical protein